MDNENETKKTNAYHKQYQYNKKIVEDSFDPLLQKCLPGASNIVS